MSMTQTTVANTNNVKAILPANPATTDLVTNATSSVERKAGMKSKTDSPQKARSASVSTQRDGKNRCNPLLYAPKIPPTGLPSSANACKNASAEMKPTTKLMKSKIGRMPTGTLSSNRITAAPTT